MTLAVLVNGEKRSDLAHALHVNDRGLSYGDGLFETALIVNGRIRFVEAHLERLHRGCQRLRIEPGATLHAEIEQIARGVREAVLKIVITRGPAGRGYRPPLDAQATRIIALYAAPAPYPTEAVARWCDMRLGRNPQLAGLKHLNRLEQVLAQAEWREPAISEGLMLDTEGEVVCGTSSNLFIVREGVLLTPDLRFCGVRGVMRAQVLRAARELGTAIEEAPLWPHDLEQASEVLLTSALRGVQSVTALDSLRWSAGPIAAKLRDALEL